MPRKRRLFLVLLAVVAAGALFTGWRALRAPSRFSEADIAKLQLGMTRMEVISILGCEPGGYDGYVGDYDIPGQIERQEAKIIGPQLNGEIWACRGAAVEVCFIDDKVSKIQRPGVKPHEHWLLRLWRRLGPR